MNKENKEDILTTAFEGGANYWVSRVEAQYPENYKETYFSEHFALGKNLIIFEDDEDATPHLLTHAKLEKGVKMVKEHFHLKTDDDVAEGDAEIADCLLQYALFGELVYG